MINLAARDILHGWGRFVFTGLGLGLLIGVTLSMAGIYRGLVDDGQALLAIGGADLWVVQRDTLGPYAEPSSVRDDAYRSLLAVPGVAEAGNVTYLTMQVQHAGRRRARDAGRLRAGTSRASPATWSPAGRSRGRTTRRSPTCGPDSG